MDGELVIRFLGVNDSEISNAISEWTIHGSWFETMADVDKKIEEYSGMKSFHSAEWVEW